MQKKLPIQQKIDSLKNNREKSEDGKTGMVPMLSVLLPERFSAPAPCTFGTQFNGILQSPLPVRSLHSGRFSGVI